MAQGPDNVIYEGVRVSQAALARRRDQLQAEQAAGLATVDRLVRQQRDVSTQLSTQLADLRKQGSVLDEIETRSRDSGLLAMLTRQLGRRRTMLERRSVTEGLITQYEAVSRNLRKASAFSDELRLCAVDLQAQVDQLHADLERAGRNQRSCAQQVTDHEHAVSELEDPGATGPDLPSDPDERARALDKATFALRTESINLELFSAQLRFNRQHLEPARQLRDTVLSLQEDMARFVMAATATVNSAGRRIQALGMAADAPAVVAELQQSLDDLSQAMEATEAYVQQSQRLLTHVLPDLSRRLEAHSEVEDDVLSTALDEVNRERARALAQQALREAADAEVDAALRGDSGEGRTL